MLNLIINKMKKTSMIIVCAMFLFSNMIAQNAKLELEKAQKSGKSIFLVVSTKTSVNTESLQKLAVDASKKAKNIAIIKINRDDKANSEIISKYRLAGVQLPIILVLASNGVASGGLTTNDASVEKLLSYLPTKTQADVLLGFENGKPALIVCGKKNAKDKSAIEAECKKAALSMGGKATQVFLDVESKSEANFLALLKPDVTKTTVLVFNGKGQYTGTLEATAKSNDLITSINKKIGGCCPSGSSSGCGKK